MNCETGYGVLGKLTTKACTFHSSISTSGFEASGSVFFLLHIASLIQIFISQKFNIIKISCNYLILKNNLMLLNLAIRFFRLLNNINRLPI